MSAKKSIDVIIDGNMYTLSGYEEPEYLQKVAAYLNGKIDEVKGLDYYKELSRDMKTVLLELNIADDLFKARERVVNAENDISMKDQEICKLKQDLVTMNVKINELEDKVKALNKNGKAD